MQNIKLPNHVKTLVIAADNDGKSTFKSNHWDNVFEHFKNQNIRHIEVAMPQKCGLDFNDILAKDGEKALTESLAKSLSKDAFKVLSGISQPTPDNTKTMREPEPKSHQKQPQIAPKITHQKGGDWEIGDM